MNRAQRPGMWSVFVLGMHMCELLRISYFKRLRLQTARDILSCPPPSQCHGACPGISQNSQGQEGVPWGALGRKPEKVPPVCVSLLGSSQSMSYNTPMLTGSGTRNGTYQGPRPPCSLSPSFSSCLLPPVSCSQFVCLVLFCLPSFAEQPFLPLLSMIHMWPPYFSSCHFHLSAHNELVRTAKSNSKFPGEAPIGPFCDP